ncbi:MAG TPA: MIP/aquaporin family protein [Candidatus Limnocylindria bacterium]|jgi:glycerol uptake facilitator protein|nr:MIP/aquaporin family protein [Candidatus Limnocylindria bacterium]
MYSTFQRALAEFFGTAALVLVGPGSVIATLTLAGKAVPAVTEADLLAISFAFGFIITALVYAIGKVSGCHINPAVTFALAVTKRFPWRELPIYWVAQFAGAILGAFAIWGVFGANAVTFGMGQTHFASDASSSYYLQAALAEALGTGLLIFAILGIVDSRSPGTLAGIVIGGAVVGIILVFGPVTGASLNPARAFGPELVQAIAGGATFWTQYVPVYLIPGLVGAAGAAFLYDFLANPRMVERPIREAVSHEDAVPAGAR